MKIDSGAFDVLRHAHMHLVGVLLLIAAPESKLRRCQLEFISIMSILVNKTADAGRLETRKHGATGV